MPPPRPLAPNDINTLSPQQMECLSPIYALKHSNSTPSHTIDPFAINFGTPRFVSDLNDYNGSPGSPNRMIVPVNLPRMLPRHEDHVSEDRLVFLDSRLRAAALTDLLDLLDTKSHKSVAHCSYVVVEHCPLIDTYPYNQSAARHILRSPRWIRPPPTFVAILQIPRSLRCVPPRRRWRAPNTRSWDS